MLLTLETRPGPVKIFDANGCEINYVVEADTETGDVEQFVYHAGQPVVENGRVKKMRFRYPAPLKIEKIDN